MVKLEMCLKEPACVRLECEPAVIARKVTHVSEFIETLDIAKDTLNHLSGNDKLFVSTIDYEKAAPNVILLG